MKIYCQKCGSGAAYNMQKPKFCQNCGHSFSGEVKAASPAKPIRKVQQPKIVEQDEEEVTIPENINKLEFDTVGTLQVKGTTVANLAGTLSAGESIERPREDSPQVNKEDFLKSFKEEAGTSRPKR
tara:strand:+ start:241 stop:618 length:378 start_codon:yes stop_codon:yes gene_type:complete